jgi:hypothetical protein
MKKHVNWFAVMVFLIALAAFVSAAKYGGHGGNGFSSGG